MEEVAKRLESRVAKIKFTKQEIKNGGTKARLNVCIKDISNIAAVMKTSNTREAEDYHWTLVADLMNALDSILTHYGV